MPFSARSIGSPIWRSTSSVGCPGKSVMTFTCVSVGSGKASMVRARNENQPQAATTSVKNSTAARFLSEKPTSRSSMSRSPLSELFSIP